MDLSFLKNITLEVIKKPVVSKKQSISVSLIPSDEVSLRVFDIGKVYPSKKFASTYDLEFKPKVDGKQIGNGLDIFSSKNWGMIMGKLPQELIFCAPISKSSPKVDMWGSSNYTEDNQPKASVYTQGTNTFVKSRLLNMLTEVYNVNWEDTEYVDLTFVEDQAITTENKIYHLPKKVSSGALKGEDTYVRRENILICPLIVAYTQFKDNKQLSLFENSAAEEVDNHAISLENSSELAQPSSFDNIEDIMFVPEEPVLDEEGESTEDWTKNLGNIPAK